MAPSEPDDSADDDFQPIGTAFLLGIYFLILLVMWIVMYYWEFLGNAPTITGA